MKLLKQWKSFDEQLSLLKERGLIISNKKRARTYLERVGYYRLSGYWYLFKQLHNKQPINRFLPDSHFDDVISLYIFDKRLRLLALDALERIEIAIRVDISYLLGKKEPLAHLSVKNFSKERYNQAIRDSKDSFIQHHIEYYGGNIPIWVACEIFSFGTLSKLFKHMDIRDKDKIARKYRLSSGSQLETHLHAFNVIRNISAHHGRLWNRHIIGRAKIRGMKDPMFHKLPNNQVFFYFCLMQRMLKVICPNSSWGYRFWELLKTFPTSKNGVIDIQLLGLKPDLELENWFLWKNK